MATDSGTLLEMFGIFIDLLYCNSKKKINQIKPTKKEPSTYTFDISRLAVKHVNRKHIKFDERSMLFEMPYG